MQVVAQLPLVRLKAPERLGLRHIKFYDCRRRVARAGERRGGGRCGCGSAAGGAWVCGVGGAAVGVARRSAAGAMLLQAAGGGAAWGGAGTDRLPTRLLPVPDVAVANPRAPAAARSRRACNCPARMIWGTPLSGFEHSNQL